MLGGGGGGGRERKEALCGCERQNRAVRFRRREHRAVLKEKFVLYDSEREKSCCSLLKEIFVLYDSERRAVRF